MQTTTELSDSESVNLMVSQISENLEVLKNVQVDETTVSNWQDYLLKQLSKNHSIESKVNLNKYLKTMQRKEKLF